MTDVLESLIEEYISEQTEKEMLQQDMNTNPSLITLIAQRKEINNEIEKIQASYKDNLNAIDTNIDNILNLIKENWNQEGKSYKCNAGIATIRTTKSLKIINKNKLIDFLIRNNILSKNIKSFDTAQIRKIKDSDLLENDIAKWDEKQSVSIKQKK